MTDKLLKIRNAGQSPEAHDEDFCLRTNISHFIFHALHFSPSDNPQLYYQVLSHCELLLAAASLTA